MQGALEDHIRKFQHLFKGNGFIVVLCPRELFDAIPPYLKVDGVRYETSFYPTAAAAYGDIGVMVKKEKEQQPCMTKEEWEEYRKNLDTAAMEHAAILTGIVPDPDTEDEGEM
jgi:hypothetical protein